MRTKILGRSDLRVSELAFGCMSLGNDHSVNNRLLHEAIDLGINFFDTADLYQKGFNEETVGLAFKGIRNQVVLATKVGNQWRADGSGWDWNPTRKYILQAADKSLARLQTDYIDLYQLHGGTLDDPIDDTIEAFELLKQQGKIKHYGISSIRPNVIREYVKRSDIVSVMMQYSLLDRRPEEESLTLLHNHNIAVLARGSLAGGLLIDKPANAYLNYSSQEVKQAAEAVSRLSGPNRTKTEIAVQFCMNHPAISCPVVGIRNAEQLKDIVRAVESEPLYEKEMGSLHRAIEINRYEQHR